MYFAERLMIGLRANELSSNMNYESPNWNVPNLFKPHNYTQLRYGQYQKIPSEITAVLADREVLRIYIETLPKAQRTRGLSSSCQSNFLRSYHIHKLKHKSASTKNLNQTSASPLNLKFKILTKPSFRISTKIQHHNINQILASIYWPDFSIKIFNFNVSQQQG